MPQWVADHKKWAKAKRQARKGKPKDFYAVVTTIYKKMGGRIKRSTLSKAMDKHKKK